jgi:hypothetical protein
MNASDYIALLGGIAGVFAAFAAWRSAEIAKEATRQGARQQRDGLMRETNLAANRVVVRGNRVIQLAAALPVAYQQLMALSGRTLAAADNVVQAKSAQQRARAQQACDAAKAVLDSPLAKESDAELADALTLMDGYLVELDGTKEALSAELDGYAEDGRIRRETDAKLRAAVIAGQPR